MTRRVALAALVLPALVLVAMTARSYQPFGGEVGEERVASTAFLDSLFTIVLVLGVLLLLILLWVRIRIMPSRDDKDRQSKTYTALLVYLGVILAVVMMGRGLLRLEPRPANVQGDPAFVAPMKPGQPVPPEPEPGRAPRVVWPLVIGTFGVIAAAIVVTVLVERRRRRPDALTPEQLKKLGEALDGAIEDLRREPDPRRAVVAAYARMEQALSVYGLPRKSAETPYEYLARVGHELDAEESVAALTDLFEEAKFSEHSVGEAMRGRAIDALVSVRHEVRAAT